MTHLIKTACPMDCYDGCSIVAKVDDQGELIQIEGNAAHPMTVGRLCGKGYKLLDRYQSSKRVLWPMKKVGGVWQRVDWDTALQEIAHELEKSIAEYGPWSIMHTYDFGSSGILKLLTDRFFNMLGGFTDVVGSLCWEAGLTAQEYDFGQPRSHDPQDIGDHAKHIVIWGRNVSVTNMHMVQFIRQAQKRGATVVVINPLRTDMDASADLVIQPKPGTDGILALAICHELITTNRYDHQFIAQYVYGFDQFAAHVRAYDKELAAHICGVPVEQFERLAAIYADGPTSTLLGIGLQRYKNGGNTVRAIDALGAISGNVGRPGGGVNYAHREVSGFVDWKKLMGRKDHEPIREFRRVSQAKDILQADPPVEVLFISRTNLVSQVPNADMTREALKSVRVKILIDSFFTQTADEVDYFLPTTMVFEEEDVMLISMWSSYLSYANQVVAPRGESRPDWVIFRDLARKLHLPRDLEIEPSAVIEEVFSSLIAQGISMEECKKEGFIQLPIEQVAYRSKDFKTPSGKFELYSKQALVHGQSPMAQPDVVHFAYNEDFPYPLLTIHPRKQENSQSPTDQQHRPYAQVEIGSQLAKQYKVHNVDRIIVETEVGKLECEVKVVAGMRNDVVKLEQGWTFERLNVNLLTLTYVSDLGHGSAQYDTHCRLVSITPPVHADDTPKIGNTIL